MRGKHGTERSHDVDKNPIASSREERAKAERRKILDRLNSHDTGAHRHDREQEERRAREVDIAREKERRADPGMGYGSGGPAG
jgi:hypothetical protein